MAAATTQPGSTVRRAQMDSTGLPGYVAYALLKPVSIKGKVYQSVSRSFPGQVSAEEEKPCVPCSCDPRGSVSQACVKDPSQATPSMQIYVYLSSLSRATTSRHTQFSVNTHFTSEFVVKWCSSNSPHVIDQSCMISCGAGFIQVEPRAPNLLLLKTAFDRKELLILEIILPFLVSRSRSRCCCLSSVCLCLGVIDSSAGRVMPV